MTPFELFKQDADEVIMLINYYVLKSENIGEQPQRTVKGEQRIRVNDKTASGGWY